MVRLHGRESAWLTVVSHAVLIAGIAVIAFPLYVTFVASTLTLDQILQVPMRSCRGSPLGELFEGADRRGRRRGRRPRGRMNAEQPCDGGRDRARQDRHLAHRLVRDRLLRFPSGNFFF